MGKSRSKKRKTRGTPCRFIVIIGCISTWMTETGMDKLGNKFDYVKYIYTIIKKKSFKTLKEAENFLEYANSILVRFTFLMTDESISSLAKKSPDILDYTESNRFIDFTKNIDKQLYSLIRLSDEEIKYIETMVKNSR